LSERAIHRKNPAQKQYIVIRFLFPKFESRNVLVGPKEEYASGQAKAGFPARHSDQCKHIKGHSNDHF
jgi:hypothetical protein